MNGKFTYSPAYCGYLINNVNQIKVCPAFTDIKYVGSIVPLPNHYISDMPQGRGLLQTFVCDRLFFISLLAPAGDKWKIIHDGIMRALDNFFVNS